jgi:aryl-alcohol dehydrogenase-like predicted oxidoreductase
LSGKYTDKNQVEEGRRRAAFDFPPVDKNRAQESIEVMRAIATAHDVSIARVALAWLLHQPQVTSVIIGAKRPDQLADNIASTELELTADELARIGDISRLPPEYPGWMFDMQGKYRQGQLHDALKS